VLKDVSLSGADNGGAAVECANAAVGAQGVTLDGRSWQQGCEPRVLKTDDPPLEVDTDVSIGAPIEAFDVEFGAPTLVGYSNYSDGCVTSAWPWTGGSEKTYVPDWNTTMSQCHYWFPGVVLQLGTGADAWLLIGVQRAGNPGGPKLASRIRLASVDGGRTYRPTPYPYPWLLLPEVPLLEDRHISTIKRLDNFSTLSTFSCAMAIKVGQKTGLKTEDSVHTTSPHWSLDDFERHRPTYHLTPARGHNNDPNGVFLGAICHRAQPGRPDSYCRPPAGSLWVEEIHSGGSTHTAER
jgi:hypothetical protein